MKQQNTITSSPPLASLVNRYGTIDCRRGRPNGVTILQGRYAATARKMDIKYYSAFWGWAGRGRYVRPDVRGICVTDADAERILPDIARRKEALERARQAHQSQVPVADQRAVATELGVQFASSTWAALIRGELDA